MSEATKLPLTVKEKRLVRDSFDSMREYETSVLMLFYGRLFEIAPETRPLFHIEIREQSAKLMHTLSILIDALDRFDELRAHLAELGSKHAAYRVQAYQYEKLRTALLWAMGQALGAAFDRETRAAWDAQQEDAPPLDVEWSEIVAGLAPVSLGVMQRATGLSLTYCAQIKRGQRVPHASYWAPLAALTS